MGSASGIRASICKRTRRVKKAPTTPLHPSEGASRGDGNAGRPLYIKPTRGREPGVFPARDA